MNVGSSIEKLSRIEKKDSSVTKRRKNFILSNGQRRNHKEDKNIPKSVDTNAKKSNENKDNIKIKSKIKITIEAKVKQLKNNNNINYNTIYKNKKRNIEIRNKKNLMNEVKSEEKENNRKNKNFIIEEIEESKGINNIGNKKIKENNKENKLNDNNIPNNKNINKLNKKSITNKNVISNKKKFNKLIDKKDSDKKKKLKRLVEKKNITERTIKINCYNINRQNEANDTENENEEIIMNTEINKYVKLSKLMRRMKDKEKKVKNNNSKRNKSSIDEDSSIKTKKINITEREEIILKNKEKENLPMTDRYENENKTYLYIQPKKRNIITNIYNCKYKKNNNNIIKSKRPEKMFKNINKKFIDTSVSFDRTNDEIAKNNKDNLIITNEVNHIEENDDSQMESSENSKTKTNENDNNYENTCKEEEELKKKEKDIKYLKLKSKHKKFSIVIKSDNDNLNKTSTIKQYTYKTDKERINKNNKVYTHNFKKAKTKNINNNQNYDKIKMLNNQKYNDERNHSINHHTTINNYQKYLNYTMQSDIKSKDSNGFLNKKNKYKNLEFSIYDDDNNILKIFDLNSICCCKNYNDIKEIKEKIKKELDNKKVKYNLKKNKYCCYYKNDNKFEIEIYPIYDINNIYIIKTIKKFGNIQLVKDISRNILSKLNLIID